VVANIADAPENPLATPWSRPQATYRIVDPVLATGLHGDGVSLAGVSHVIYMNNCKSGCTMHPGNDSSLTNTSSIPNQTSTVTAWQYSDALWQQLVDCVRSDYAPFNVQVVTERPTSGDYHMAIVAGRPQDVQMQSGVGGVSPFTCDYIPNSISYTFANVYGGDLEQMCWTVAQETAHSWGLDHKFDNRDPMTYLETGPAHKMYQNEAGSCGEYSARTCMCSYDGSRQAMNAFAEIMKTFGPNGPPTPPSVKISSPHDGDDVSAAFAIRVDATDDQGIARVEVRIDNNLVDMLTTAPYTTTAPMTLSMGAHTIKVTAYDIAMTPSDATATVTLGHACSGDDCPSGQGCVDGRCVDIGGDGGLGSSCTMNTDCISNQCASDGTQMVCVETCNPTNSGNCPSGFGCVASGGNGVCWPGADNGGSGCNAGAAQGGLLCLGLAMWITRRKRLKS
jgi:hypothetical protein